ncbi:MAG: hypothetical protein ACOCSD_06835 [Halolamina sp.]
MTAATVLTASARAHVEAADALCLGVTVGLREVLASCRREER